MRSANLRGSSAFRVLAGSAFAVSAMLSVPSAHAAALVLFDDFSGGAISPYRWYGSESAQYGSSRAESRRAVASGSLRLEAKGYSDNYGNVGTSTTRNALYFVKSPAITDIRATITMRTATAQACAGNPAPTLARARVFGFFFNAGYPQAGSEYGDVFAQVIVYRASNSTDAAGVMQVSANVGICTDDSCIGSTTVSSLSLGTAALNAPVDVQISWDKAHKQFTFQRNTDTPVSIPYTYSDLQPPEGNVKRIEVANNLAQCTGSRVFAYSGADFDNIMTNALPTVITNATVSSVRARPIELSDVIHGGIN